MTTPPVADVLLPWDAVVENPCETLAGARAEHGDTFYVDSGGTRYLFVFGPTGVRSFYALPEQLASKGIADWQMLRRKVPDELFDGRRTFPHDLFGRSQVESYLAELDTAVASQISELGDAGEVDIFALTRRLGHRLGLASWAGWRPDSDGFDAMADALDALDGAAAFVDPGAMAQVAANDKAAERAAMLRAEALLAPLVENPSGELFIDIVSRWADVTGDERIRGISRDVILVHLGSMSNLFAALGWMLVHLLQHPGFYSAVESGDSEVAERCALESTRIAQRSIMMRSVMSEVDVETEFSTCRMRRGDIVATLLPLTNMSAAGGLDHFDPDRWERRRLRDETGLAAKELVTTFGHGKHTCPAQPFSLAAMTKSMMTLLGTYELTALFDDVRPPPGQIGGVARSAAPAIVRYRHKGS